MINDLAKVVMWTNKNICIEGGERSGLRRREKVRQKIIRETGEPS